MATMTLPAIDGCLFCDRVCPRCRYEISGNWEHIEQPQPEGSNVVVCKLARVKRPLTEILNLYFDHAQHPQGLVAGYTHAVEVVLPLMRLWGWA